MAKHSKQLAHQILKKEINELDAKIDRLNKQNEDVITETLSMYKTAQKKEKKSPNYTYEDSQLQKGKTIQEDQIPTGYRSLEKNTLRYSHQRDYRTNPNRRNETRSHLPRILLHLY
ncbi:hypothetical protein GWI33_001300 [Rhynchophorus ferrugineus]|uniref:Uncharacterized protein n=1 Tax=Rhynchophorus ferrugineus TaxID=354439 RepID=A0A834HYC0_RHYFE|nr:hypothetical protein GWI33_001300 [Rhynchophorus ferrugineus]